MEIFVLFLKVYISFLILNFLQVVNSNKFEYLTELGPSRLANFDGLASQTLFQWPNQHNSEFVIKLLVTRNQSGVGLNTICPDTNVNILIRQDGIPVSNPYHTQSPESTLDHQYGVLYSGNFSFPSINSSISHFVNVSTTLSLKTSNVFVSLFLLHDEDVAIPLSGLTKDCKFYGDVTVFRKLMNISQSTFENDIMNMSNVVKLKRQKLSLFDVHYITPSPIYYIKNNEVKTFRWNVYPLTDSGGNLFISITNYVANNASANSTLIGCLIRDIKVFRNQSCDGGYLISINNYNNTRKWTIPYPQSGSWFLHLYLEDSLIESVAVVIDIRVISCIESCHSNKKQGKCNLYQQDEILYTACSCKANWQGVACTDDTNIITYNQLLLRTLLLVLSNLIFLFCSFLAISRKFYAESFVYFYVFFMSSFYHACDQPGIIVFCLLPYDTLQFCDFLASISAIWFTFVLIARLHCPKFESWLHAFGCLGVASLVSYDRFSLWSFLIPILIGCIVVFTNWILVCKNTQKCFPGKRVMVFSILPGLLFAITGFLLYAFVETESNYYITHSIWHISMAIAVLFLLPSNCKPENSNYNVEVNYATVEHLSMSTSRVNISDQVCLPIS